MTRTLFSGTLFVAGWMAATTALAGDSVSLKVLASSSSWKPSGITLQPGQVAEINPSGLWFINPLWSKKFGAGGNRTLSAAGDYALEGAHEGCLLVAVGQKVFAFDHDRQIMKVTGPGAIAFMANDGFGAKDAAPDAGRQKIAGIPVDGSEKECVGGYVDNRGALTVTITLRKP